MFPTSTDSLARTTPVTRHTVHIHTTGNVNSGSGFANIKPVHGGTLTDLIFTPEDNTAFSDFSFRGQLNAAAARDGDTSL